MGEYKLNKIKTPPNNKVYSAYPAGYAPYTERWATLGKTGKFSDI